MSSPQTNPTETAKDGIRDAVDRQQPPTNLNLVNLVGEKGAKTTSVSHHADTSASHVLPAFEIATDFEASRVGDKPSKGTQSDAVINSAIDKFTKTGTSAGLEAAAALGSLVNLHADEDLLNKVGSMGGNKTLDGLETARLLNGETSRGHGKLPVGVNDLLNQSQMETVDKLVATYATMAANGAITTESGARYLADVQKESRVQLTPEERKAIESLFKKAGTELAKTGQKTAHDNQKKESNSSGHSAGDNQPSTPAAAAPGRPSGGDGQKSATDAADSPHAIAEKPVPPAQSPPLINQVASSDFTKRAEDLLDKLDTSKSGHISKEDLAKAMEDPRYKGQDAQVLAAMYENYDKLKSVWNDGIYGLGKKDLEDYSKLEQKYTLESQNAARMSLKASDPNFIAKVNDTGTPYVTQDSLERALAGNKLTDDERQTALYMYDNFGSIENCHGDRYFWNKQGISTGDMSDYYGKVTQKSDYDAVRYVNFSLYRTNASQNSASNDLYADKAHPENSITPDAIQQGLIGDCYFEAGLASLAKQNPTAIKNMIKDNHDGTYTVTFPGNPDDPIKVTAPTEAERGTYNSGSPNGTWASVIEKAYGAYCQEHFWRRSPFNLGGGYTPAEGGDGGGRGSGLELLTGHNVDTHMLMIDSQSDVRNYLSRAFSSNPPKAVMTGINGGLPFQGDNTAGGFPRGHMYSITAFDANGPDGGTVTIRNPWGGGNDTTSGTIKISVKQYMDNFSDMYEER